MLYCVVLACICKKQSWQKPCKIRLLAKRTRPVFRCHCSNHSTTPEVGYIFERWFVCVRGNTLISHSRFRNDKQFEVGSRIHITTKTMRYKPLRQKEIQKCGLVVKCIYRSFYFKVLNQLCPSMQKRQRNIIGQQGRTASASRSHFRIYSVLTKGATQKRGLEEKKKKKTVSFTELSDPDTITNHLPPIWSQFSGGFKRFLLSKDIKKFLNPTIILNNGGKNNVILCPIP